MSHLWLSKVDLLIMADRVLIEYSVRGKDRHRTVHAIPIRPADSALAVSEAITAYMLSLPISVVCQIQIHICDHWVHYLLLQASPVLLSQQDQEAYAKAILLQTFGDAATDWPFRVQYSRKQIPNLLACIPILAKEVAIQWRRHQVWGQISIQPYATALLNQVDLPATGTIVLFEHHMARLLQLDQAQVRHISSWVGRHTEVESWLDWVTRERILLAAVETPCYWVSEPNRPSIQKLIKALPLLPGKISWQYLQATKKITGLWQEVNHVA